MLKASEKRDKSDDSPVTIADYGESFCSIHGVLSLFIRLVTWPAPPQLGPPISSPSVRMSATASLAIQRFPHSCGWLILLLLYRGAGTCGMELAEGDAKPALLYGRRGGLK